MDVIHLMLEESQDTVCKYVTEGWICPKLQFSLGTAVQVKKTGLGFDYN